jgi:hypothetical protein
MTGSANYAYQGVATPGDSDHQFNAQVNLVQRLINQRHTITVAKIVGTSNIVEYGSAEPIKTIDVLPLVNEVTGAGQPVPHQTVYGVPYLRLQGGSNAVIVDPVIGDLVIFAAAETDISSALKTGQQSNPGSARRNNYSDGMCLGCISAGTPTQYFSFTATGLKIADKNGNVLTTDADGWHINGALINMSGDVITKAGHDLDTHLHSDVTHGSDDTGPPV